MIENYLSLNVNRKEDIELIEKVLKDQKIDVPIFILEFENCFKINFTSEYEQWELEREIINVFPDYEFTENLGKGRKEIRIQLSRKQSPLSTDDWGRPLETHIDETKYLIKKSNESFEKFTPQVKVLFESSERYYFVNIIKGINRVNDKKGFLLLNEYNVFDTKKDCGFFQNELFETPIAAYWSGISQIEQLANLEFIEYIKEQKKLRRKKRK